MHNRDDMQQVVEFEQESVFACVYVFVGVSAHGHLF